MDPDDFEEFVEAALKQQQQQQPQPQQKVIVQRNSPPILFPGGGPLTLNATSSLLVPNSAPIQAQPPPPQLSFGSVTATAGGSSLVDATSVIVLNKDSSLAPMTIPINVVTAAVDQPQQQQPSSQFMQKVVMAAAAGPSGQGSVQLMPAGTMKTLQHVVYTPRFKRLFQYGNTETSMTFHSH